VVAINLIGISCVLLVFEMVLRVATPEWLRYRMEQLRAGGTPNEFGSDEGWKLIERGGQFVSFVPGSEMDFVHREYRNHARIDELGGRQVVPQSNATLLLPMLGDSFTFGVGVGDEETFPSVLQGSMAERLVNLGVPGTSLERQVAIVKARHVELKRPPVYVFCFFLGNDFEEMLYYSRSTPVAAAKPVSSWVVGLNRVVVNSWLRRSYLIQFLRQPLRTWINRRHSSTMLDPVFKIMNTADTAYRDQVRARVSTELDALVALGRQLDFRFLFVLVPDKHQVFAQQMRAGAKYYGLTDAPLDRMAPNRLLLDLLRQRNIPAIDPTDALAKSADPSLYYVYDNHFTVAGHRFFAQAIGAPLRAQLATLLK
jgi:hypothetical protein